MMHFSASNGIWTSNLAFAVVDETESKKGKRAEKNSRRTFV